MTRHKWKLTEDAKIDEWPAGGVDQPFSILAELAKDPANGLIEIRPGLYSSTPAIEGPPTPEG